MSDRVLIHVIGPTATGKSIISARIEKILTEEFGAEVVAKELELERRKSNPDEPEAWERGMLRNNTFHIVETCVPSAKMDQLVGEPHVEGHYANLQAQNQDELEAEVVIEKTFPDIHDHRTVLQMAAAMILTGTPDQVFDACVKIGLIPADTPRTEENIVEVSMKVADMTTALGLKK